jgi:hypothetical protein
MRLDLKNARIQTKSGDMPEFFFKGRDNNVQAGEADRRFKAGVANIAGSGGVAV